MALVFNKFCCLHNDYLHTYFRKFPDELFPFYLDTYTKHCAWIKSMIWLLSTCILYHIPSSMEQSPSWEANSSSAHQETPRILRNAKLYHRKTASTIPTLNQISPRPPYTSFFLYNVPTERFLWILWFIFCHQISGLKTCCTVSRYLVE